MAASSTTYLLIPLTGQSLIEGPSIRCQTVQGAEILADMLGFRKFKVIQEVELISVVRDKTLGKKNERVD